MLEKKHLDTTLQLVFDLGMYNDKQKFRRKSFTGIKQDSTLQNLNLFATTIEGLQTKPLYKTFLNERSEIQEEIQE